MKSTIHRAAKRGIFAEAKERYTIYDVWGPLGLSGDPKKCRKSPFRDDRKPSFSIYDDGRKFKDHGTGESGDVIDFVRLMLGCDYAGVRDFFGERLGIDHLDHYPAKSKKAAPKTRTPRQIKWPKDLKRGGKAELERFSRSRGLSSRTAGYLKEAGIVIPCTLSGHDCYIVTDKTDRAAEIRRRDRELFGKSKAYPLSGVDKSWPVGLELLRESLPEVGVMLLEGATDLISAYDLYIRYRRDHGGSQQWVPAALLGANCRNLHPEAIELIKGRYVRLVPDGDDAGEAMAKHWSQMLRQHGCIVDVVSLGAGTDLTDHISTVSPTNLFDR